MAETKAAVSKEEGSAAASTASAATATATATATAASEGAAAPSPAISAAAAPQKRKIGAAEAGWTGSEEETALLKTICKELEEENELMVGLVIETMGCEDATALLEATREAIKSDKGNKTTDGSRERSPGGVFLHLAREKLGAAKFNVLSGRVKKHRKLAKAAENNKKAAPKDKKPVDSEEKKDSETKETKKPEDAKATEEAKPADTEASK